MHITLMVWYLQLCMPSAHFLVDPYGFWVTGFVSGSQDSTYPSGKMLMWVGQDDISCLDLNAHRWELKSMS
ncbi:hypothetical protein Lepto7375DRAFT_0030 [Leptolyngbya sp. PCC 7375]|nr:hypothetical protein Lepto7375DRAFT_0030 [Leptolyngbya sp. PCC 7375]